MPAPVSIDHYALFDDVVAVAKKAHAPTAGWRAICVRAQRTVPVPKRFVFERAAKHDPEVLVPPDEAKAFALFVARVARRDEVVEAFVSPATKGNDELPEIAPVEIAHLQLQPLVWEKWK